MDDWQTVEVILIPNFGETKRRLQVSPVQEEFQPAGQAADPQVQPRQAEDQRGLQPV